MAEKYDTDDIIEIDGKKFIRITPGRARHISDALRAGLPEVDKHAKGVVTSLLRALETFAAGATLKPPPECLVYVRAYEDEGPTKIGHARNLDQRLRRNTDSPRALKLFAAWRFDSVEEAMEREAEARAPYERTGDGGVEWVLARTDDVVARLTAKWGVPERIE